MRRADCWPTIWISTGPQLTAELVDGPQSGTLTLQPSGAFVYQPNAGFTGQDRFTYRMNDSLTTSDRGGSPDRGPAQHDQRGESDGRLGRDLQRDHVQPGRVRRADSSGSSCTTRWPSTWTSRVGKLTGGIYFQFPEGTVIPGNGFLVIAANPAGLEEDTGFAGRPGPFSGRLDNGGEELILRNNSDRIMDILDYDDAAIGRSVRMVRERRWPSAVVILATVDASQLDDQSSSRRHARCRQLSTSRLHTGRHDFAQLGLGRGLCRPRDGPGHGLA